jgi:hypothetical protein
LAAGTLVPAGQHPARPIPGFARVLELVRGFELLELLDQLVIGTVEALQSMLALGTSLDVAGDDLPLGAGDPAGGEQVERTLLGTKLFRHGWFLRGGAVTKIF